jgi:hypothetical protein
VAYSLAYVDDMPVVGRAANMPRVLQQGYEDWPDDLCEIRYRDHGNLLLSVLFSTPGVVVQYQLSQQDHCIGETTTTHLI